MKARLGRLADAYGRSQANLPIDLPLFRGVHARFWMQVESPARPRARAL
jgi:hypothetical protein